MLLNCDVGEGSWESLGLQGDPTFPFHSQGDQSWVFFGKTDDKAETPVFLATSCKELTHWRRLWCWEGLGAGGEGDDRGWDGWMASPLDGHEFELTVGVGDGQGDLACCSSWGHKESDTIERLNWTELNWCVCVCVCVCVCECLCARPVTQSCLTLCNLWTPTCQAFHGISLARTLELDAISSSRGSSLSRDQTYISWIGKWTLYKLHHLGRAYKYVYVCVYVCVCIYTHTSTHISSLFIYWWTLRWRGLRGKNYQFEMSHGNVMFCKGNNVNNINMNLYGFS